MDTYYLIHFVTEINEQIIIDQTFVKSLAFIIYCKFKKMKDLKV